MKERSLVERMRAIIGVLGGTVSWVGRLVWSLLRSVLKNVVSKGSKGTGNPTETVKQVASDAKDRVQATAATATQGDDTTAQHDAGQGEAAAASEARSSTDTQSTSLTGHQHEDIGGVPPEFRTGNDEEGFAGRGYTYTDTQARYGIDTEDVDHGNKLAEGVPYIEEPGGDDHEGVGSEQHPVSDTEGPVSDYAGQVVSESDLGIDRPDSGTDLAGSMDDDDGGDGDADMYDVVNREDMGSHPASSGETNGVGAASRGWTDDEEDPLADDPLYGDFEPMETGEEVDLRNDEADEATGANMHVVDTPNEPFVDDEPTPQDLGLSGVLEEVQVEPELSDVESIDDVTNREATVIDDGMLAADATGKRIGGDPASGDLGPEQSYDDTERNVIESREPGEVVGDYGGSGIDEFADDAVAEDLMNSTNTSDTTETTASAGDGGDDSGNTNGGRSGGGGNADSESTQSAAWASSAGVVDTGLTMPQSADDLQTGTDMSQSEAEAITDADDDPGAPGSRKEVRDEFMVDGSESEAVKAPQYDQPQDGGLRDVAAEMADDMDVDEFKRSDPPGDVGQGRTRDRSPSQGRAADAPAGAIRGDGSATCPADYPIKGNARSRVYHTPADSAYEDTVPEFCFASEEHARAAGFRPRKS